MIIANVSVTFFLRGREGNKFPGLFIHQKQSISATDAAASPLQQNVTDLMCNCYLSLSHMLAACEWVNMFST